LLNLSWKFLLIPLNRVWLVQKWKHYKAIEHDLHKAVSMDSIIFFVRLTLVLLIIRKVFVSKVYGNEKISTFVDETIKIKLFTKWIKNVLTRKVCLETNLQRRRLVLYISSNHHNRHYLHECSRIWTHPFRFKIYC
jgi:hypothetical protein